MSQKLSCEAYKGTRDFYPDDYRIQKYIFSIMRESVEKFGYEEYNASILEETALYKAKSGTEIVDEQTYSFIDRGGRDVTIRPEMTPTVARMIAKKRKELAFPLRWYSIPNLFRYERPQRGRLREHWQLNVDFFGSNSPFADTEVIMISDAIMKNFGAHPDQYIIKINNRAFINFVLSDYFDLTPEESHAVLKLIDRKNKISLEQFISDGTIITDLKIILSLLSFLDTPSFDELPKELRDSQSAEPLKILLANLTENGITNVIFDPTVIRGFDYYTGNIFEIFDLHPENNRSLFGGGRYDDLVGIFDVEPISGFGFGMGDVTLRDFLILHKLLPEFTSTTDIYICIQDSLFVTYATKLADELRRYNVHVSVDFTLRKLDKQIKTAHRQNIPYILCIGKDEVENNIFKLKELSTSTEQIVSRDEIIRILEKN